MITVSDGILACHAALYAVGYVCMQYDINPTVDIFDVTENIVLANSQTVIEVNVYMSTFLSYLRY